MQDFSHDLKQKTKTQVGSPAVLLRLTHCTSWVKRWSEAMDFLLARLWPCTKKMRQKNSRIWRNICPYSYKSKVRQKSPKFDATCVPIVINQKWSKKSRFWHYLKQSNSTCSKLYKYGKRFHFAPSFNNLD